MRSSRSLAWRASGWVIALGTAACGSDPMTGPSPLTTSSFTITPLHQWAGGTIEIRSAAFRQLPDGSFRILVAGDTVAGTRLDDTTIAITPPDLGTRAAAVIVSGGDTSAAIGTIHLYGLSDASTLATPILSDYSPWPVAHPSGVLGRTAAGNLAVADLLTGAVTTFEPAYTGNYGIGPGYAAGTVAIPGASANDSTGIWQLGAPSTMLGALPFNSQRYQWQIAPFGWLQCFHASCLATASSDSGQSWDDSVRVPISNGWRIAYSPDGTRVALVGDKQSPDTGAVAVLTAATGSLPYLLPGIFIANDAVFSADGTTLYVSGDYADSGAAVIAISSQTGAVTHVARVSGGGEPFALAVDSSADRLYALILHTGDASLAVFNGTTLGPVAQVRLGTGACTFCFPWAMTVSPDDHAVHVLLESDKTFRVDPPPQ